MNAILIVMIISTITAAKLGEVMSNSATVSTDFIEICCSPFVGISCAVCILFLVINYMMALSSGSTSARKEAKISIVFIIAIILFLTSTRILRWKTQENSQKSTTTGSSASSSYLSSLSTEELQKRHDKLLFVYDNKITNMTRDDFFDYLAIRDELQKRVSEEVNEK